MQTKPPYKNKYFDNSRNRLSIELFTLIKILLVYQIVIALRRISQR